MAAKKTIKRKAAKKKIAKKKIIKRSRKVKMGPVDKGGYQKEPKHKTPRNTAITPKGSIEDLADRVAAVDVDQEIRKEISPSLENQFWIARMLGELFTIHQITEAAIKTHRKGIYRELIASVRQHHIWKKVIDKFRVNWLYTIYGEMPLATPKVRLRELSRMYYMLTGQYPAVKHHMNQYGEIKIVDKDKASEDISNFDPKVACIHIDYKIGEGRSIKVKQDNYFKAAAGLLEQIRIELEHMDKSMSDDAAFIKIIRDCGFEDYEPE